MATVNPWSSKSNTNLSSQQEPLQAQNNVLPSDTLSQDDSYGDNDQAVEQFASIMSEQQTEKIYADEIEKATLQTQQTLYNDVEDIPQEILLESLLYSDLQHQKEQSQIQPTEDNNNNEKPATKSEPSNEQELIEQEYKDYLVALELQSQEKQEYLQVSKTASLLNNDDIKNFIAKKPSAFHEPKIKPSPHEKIQFLPSNVPTSSLSDELLLQQQQQPAIVSDYMNLPTQFHTEDVSTKSKSPAKKKKTRRSKNKKSNQKQQQQNGEKKLENKDKNQESNNNKKKDTKAKNKNKESETMIEVEFEDEMISKHDSEIWNQKHVQRLNTYDDLGSIMDDSRVNIGNQAFNSLRKELQKRNFTRYDGKIAG